MAHFNSLRSFKSEAADPSGEPDFFDPFQMSPSTVPSQEAENIYFTDALPTFSPTNSDKLEPYAAEHTTSMPLHGVQSTQSLVAALQATMQPSVQVRRSPIIIPGARKRSQLVRNTDALPLHTRRLHPKYRSLSIFAATVAILLLTLITFTPIVSAQSSLPVFGNAIKWVQSQQQNWSVIAHMDPPTATPVPVVAFVGAPAAPLPAMALPRSQYVAIAQQDAIAAGIPADAFVRQINQESGFNPNAYSPAGAVGIAQFLPSTAAGLGINPYDPISALRGAAQYMARLAASFGGNYAMGLAAYNAGSGNVNRAISLGGANWLAFMPLETQNYVRLIMG